MGKIFVVRCPECGHEFQQFNGVGLDDFKAGVEKKNDDKFYCPNCKHEFDPTAEGFGYCIIGEGFWD